MSAGVRFLATIEKEERLIIQKLAESLSRQCQTKLSYRGRQASGNIYPLISYTLGAIFYDPFLAKAEDQQSPLRYSTVS